MTAEAVTRNRLHRFSALAIDFVNLSEIGCGGPSDRPTAQGGGRCENGNLCRSCRAERNRAYTRLKRAVLEDDARVPPLLGLWRTTNETILPFLRDLAGREDVPGGLRRRAQGALNEIGICRAAADAHGGII